MKYRNTPEEARTMLVEALRSGDYEQGKGSLHPGELYCCLGVACDLFGKVEGVGKWGPANNARPRSFLLTEREDEWSKFGGLPAEVQEWLGFSGDSGALVERVDDFYSLAHLNDGGYDFPEIADIIEAGLVATALKG